MKEATRSRDWYVSVLGAKATSDQGEFQWVELGGTELLLRPGRCAANSSYKETAIAIVLYVEDAAKFKTNLAAKGVEVTHGDNDDCLTFQDPDGHWIQAVQN